MKNYIKRVQKFAAAQFTGLESIDSLLDITKQRGYRVESNNEKPVVFLKTTDVASRVVEDSDIRMETGYWLVRGHDHFLIMTSGDFREEFEVAR